MPAKQPIFIEDEKEFKKRLVASGFTMGQANRMFDEYDEDEDYDGPGCLCCRVDSNKPKPQPKTEVKLKSSKDRSELTKKLLLMLSQLYKEEGKRSKKIELRHEMVGEFLAKTKKAKRLPSWHIVENYLGWYSIFQFDTNYNGVTIYSSPDGDY